MALEFRLFAVPFIVSAIISVVVAMLVLQRQNVKAGLTLALFLLEFAIWAGANAVRWSLVDTSAQVFWLTLAHASLIPAPATFLIFVAQLTDNDRWLTNFNLLFVASEPLLTLLIIATNGSHFLFYSYFQVVTVRGFPEMIWGRGPWFWVNTGFEYFFIAAAVITLIRALLRAGPYLRVQLITVLIGCLLPWAVNIYAMLWSPIAGQVEFTPLAATGSCLIFAYAVLRQRLLDIIPVARSMLFEKLADGVLVLDLNGRILDANAAGERILHLKDESLGKVLWDVLPQWRDWAGMLNDPSPELRFELQGRLDASRYYDVTAIYLQNGRGRRTGRLISLRDITDRKQAELDLNKMNIRLQRQVRKVSALHAKLQEQAIRDPLTGLYNRRYLDETMEREFSRARRASYPISIIMMDVDEFKAVNDTYGHKAGDRVLRSLADIITRSVRVGDIPCRFGGEEFVLVLPETSAETAAQRADQILSHFSAARYFRERDAIVPTLSIGVAAYPSHGRSAAKLLQAADMAMYSAKSAGGNRTVIYASRRKMAAVPR